MVKDIVFYGAIMIPSRKYQSGLSLLEVLLAVSIIIFLGSLQLTRIKNETEATVASVVGEHLATVGGAFSSYLVIHYNNITQNVSVSGTGTADDPGPRNCTQISGTEIHCTITTETLRANGLLPNSFSGRNAYGSAYRYLIRVTGVAPHFQVDGLVVTNEPFTTGGTPRFDLIGQAMLKAGSDAGTTRIDPEIVVGLNGGWTEENYGATSFTDGGIDELGLLAYRAGYGTSGYMSFLRRDGSLPMTGPLNMDWNDIMNAGEINSDGLLTNYGLRVVEPREDALILGSDSTTERTIIGNSGTSLRVVNQGGIQFQDEAGNRTPVVAGNANFDGTLAVAEDADLQGDVDVGENLNVLGTIHAGSTITSTAEIEAAELISNGSIRANDTVFSHRLMLESTPGSGTGSLFTSTEWMMEGGVGFVLQDPATRMVRFTGDNLHLDGDLATDGHVNAGQNVIVGGSLQINSRGIGSPCSTQGDIARSPDGRVISCIAGVWEPAGYRDRAVVTGTSGTASTATCAPGYKLAGGGYTLTGWTPPSGTGTGYILQSPIAPAISRPGSGNSWYVQASAGGSPSGSTFSAYAICER